jgi:hypothetical protein
LAKLKAEDGANYPASFSEMDLRDKILEYYAGFSWDGKTEVSNPFSILRFFNESKYKNYWIDEGYSLHFILSIVKLRSLDMVNNLSKSIEYGKLLYMDYYRMMTAPLLFQTGYLTVDKLNESADDWFYLLKKPNLEIKNSFNIIFNDIFSPASRDISYMVKGDFIRALRSGDEQGLAKIIEDIFADLLAGRQISEKSFFHGGLYQYGLKLADEAKREQVCAWGYWDLTLIYRNIIYIVIELKYKSEDPDIDENEKLIQSLLNEMATSALKSIKEKKYGPGYESGNQLAIDVGLGVYGRGRVVAKIRERTSRDVAVNASQRRSTLV